MIMGVSRSAYIARCRFHSDQPPGKIRFYFVPETHERFLEPTVFYPWKEYQQYKGNLPYGELVNSPRPWDPGTDRYGETGTSYSGPLEHFLGRSPFDPTLPCACTACYLTEVSLGLRCDYEFVATSVEVFTVPNTLATNVKRVSFYSSKLPNYERVGNTITIGCDLATLAAYLDTDASDPPELFNSFLLNIDGGLGGAGHADNGIWEITAIGQLDTIDDDGTTDDSIDDDGTTDDSYDDVGDGTFITVQRRVDFADSDHVLASAPVLITAGKWWRNALLELLTLDDIVLNTTKLAFAEVAGPKRHHMLTGESGSTPSVYSAVEMVRGQALTWFEVDGGWRFSTDVALSHLAESNRTSGIAPGTIVSVSRGFYDGEGHQEGTFEYCCQPFVGLNGPPPPPPPESVTDSTSCAQYLGPYVIVTLKASGNTCSNTNGYQIPLHNAAWDGSGLGTWSSDTVTINGTSTTATLVATAGGVRTLSIDCGGVVTTSAISAVCAPLHITFAPVTMVCCADPIIAHVTEGISDSAPGVPPFPTSGDSQAGWCGGCSGGTEPGNPNGQAPLSYRVTTSGFANVLCTMANCADWNGTFLLTRQLSSGDGAAFYSTGDDVVNCDSTHFVRWQLEVAWNTDCTLRYARLYNGMGDQWVSYDFNCKTGAATWIRESTSTWCSGGAVSASVSVSDPEQPSPTDGLPHPCPGCINTACCPDDSIPPQLVARTANTNTNGLFGFIYEPIVTYNPLDNSWHFAIASNILGRNNLMMRFTMWCDGAIWKMKVVGDSPTAGHDEQETTGTSTICDQGQFLSIFGFNTMFGIADFQVVITPT